MDPYPAVFVRCLYPFLPQRQRPHVTGNTFGTRENPCKTIATGSAISGLQSFADVQAPPLARPPDRSHRSPQTGRPGRVHHASPRRLPAPGCGIATCLHGHLTRLDLHQLDGSLVGCSFPHCAFLFTSCQGLWDLSGWERFLVNGQHTLTALMQEGLAAWLTVVEIDVPTLAAIGRLYEAFDRNMTRSMDDIYQSNPEIGRYGWTTKQLKAMSGAGALLATGVAQDAPFADILLTLRDPCVRAELLRDWRGEATQAFGAMQGQLWRYPLRSGVLSVLLATSRSTPQQAAQFWPAVCQDSGLTEGRPARALVHGTKNAKMRATQGLIASPWCDKRLPVTEPYTPLLGAGGRPPPAVASQRGGTPSPTASLLPTRDWWHPSTPGHRGASRQSPGR